MSGRRGRGRGGRGGVTTSNGNETAISPATPALEAALQELLQAIRQITPVTPLLPEGGAFARLCKEFTDLGGSTFDGNESPIEVDNWLCLCERVFEKMEVTELQKRELAVHQLRSTAASWWKMTSLGVNEGTMQDEGMTVTEYVNRFDELSIYEKGLIDTPNKKNEKFVMGLLPSIQKHVLRLLYHTFDEVLSTALLLEHHSMKTKRDEANVEEIKPQRSKGFGFQPYAGRSESLENVQCFTCYKMGHYSSRCPEKGSGSRC